MAKKKVFGRIVFLWICLCSISTFAETKRMSVSGRASREELLSLPEYCQVQRYLLKDLYFGTPQVPGPEVYAKRKQWADIFGEGNYNYMHHYCWGLARLARVFEPIPKYPEYALHRKTNLMMAKREFEFVRLRVTKDWPLWAELLVNEAIALRELGDSKKSVNFLLEAIKKKKDYPRAYIELSEILKRERGIEQARDVLTKGLEATGGAEEIMAAIQRLEAEEAIQKRN